MKRAIVLGSESYGYPFRKYALLRSIPYSYAFHSGTRPTDPAVTTKPDFVIFTGGCDLHPQMYGETPNGAVGWSNGRDQFEHSWFDYCKDNKIPMVGICRGMQLFTALTGGKLIQHVDGHGGCIHPIHDRKRNLDIYVNSIHHQACVPKEGTAEVLAESKKDRIVEAAYWKDVKALGVQFHPEMLLEKHEGRLYFDSLMEEYILS